MKRTHRTAHLWMWAILGPATIALLVAALASRPARPIQPTIDTPLQTPKATP